MKIDHYIMKPNKKSKKWRSHLGLYSIAEDGTLFVPSEIAGMSSTLAFLCASFDGISYISTKHLKKEYCLFPIDWLISITSDNDLKEKLELVKKNMMATHIK